MATWVLLVLVYVGGMSDREANALATVPGFTSARSCEAAAQRAQALDTGTKSVRAVCVEVK